jgi:hypothetical protein
LPMRRPAGSVSPAAARGGQWPSPPGRRRDFQVPVGQRCDGEPTVTARAHD